MSRLGEVDELARALEAAQKEDVKGGGGGCGWELLFLVGIYTGLRLGDCCMLEWNSVNLERKVIQVIPHKTRKHAHGRPVTIPIHPVLFQALYTSPTSQTPQTLQTSKTYVLPQMAAWYREKRWHVSEGLQRIFKAANIVTSVRIEGRRHKAPEATFHSLRHTFVSFAANAGVPLPIVQSIVGHTSTAMTRHYYHEQEGDLWRAVEAIPAIGRDMPARTQEAEVKEKGGRPFGERLKALDALLTDGTITKREHELTRARILAEI